MCSARKTSQKFGFARIVFSNLVAEADADGDGPADRRDGEQARPSAVLGTQALKKELVRKRFKRFSLLCYIRVMIFGFLR